LLVGWCEQKTIHAASGSGSTPDLTSLGLAAAATAAAADVDASASVFEKFYQQAAAGQSPHSDEYQL